MFPKHSTWTPLSLPTRIDYAWSLSRTSDIVSSVNDASSGIGAGGTAPDGEPAPDGKPVADGEPVADGKAEAAELLAAVGAIRRVVRRAVRTSAVAQALPPARSELLRLTARQPGISVADAAHELRLAPNSVSTMVSQLTADGLLTRSRAACDGRSVRLEVTPAGAERIAQWQDIRADVAGRALELISEPDRRAIRAAIGALNRLAQQMEEL
jgi:DNA-binding MarR family transcriptional regulator